MKRQSPLAACCLLPAVVLLGSAVSAPLAPLPVWAGQSPTATPAGGAASADALAWAALPWACGLEALAVLLGLYLVLGRHGRDESHPYSAPTAEGRSEE